MTEEYPNTYEANKSQTLAGTTLTCGYTPRLMATERSGRKERKRATIEDNSLMRITFSTFKIKGADFFASKTPLADIINLIVLDKSQAAATLIGHPVAG